MDATPVGNLKKQQNTGAHLLHTTLKNEIQNILKFVPGYCNIFDLSSGNRFYQIVAFPIKLTPSFLPPCVNSPSRAYPNPSLSCQPENPSCLFALTMTPFPENTQRELAFGRFCQNLKWPLPEQTYGKKTEGGYFP